MNFNKFENNNNMGVDALKEIGSIGTGNSATALSNILGRKIEMTIPDVKVVDFNRAIKELGGPEKVVVGVLVELTGEVKGIMLFLQNLEFINIVLDSLLGKKIESYDEIDTLEVSALTEVGNIIISSYISAMSTLTGIKMSVSVPSVSINMLGGIMNVPMAMYGYNTDKLMTINGTFKCDEAEIYSRVIMLPDMESLEYIMKKLGVSV